MHTPVEPKPGFGARLIIIYGIACLLSLSQFTLSAKNIAPATPYCWNDLTRSDTYCGNTFLIKDKQNIEQASASETCTLEVTGDFFDCEGNGTLLTASEGFVTYDWGDISGSSNTYLYIATINYPFLRVGKQITAVDADGCIDMVVIQLTYCRSLVEGTDFLLPETGCSNFNIESTLPEGPIMLKIGYSLTEGGPFDYTVDPTSLVTPADGETIYYDIFFDPNNNFEPDECGDCTRASGSYTLTGCPVIDDVHFDLGDPGCENLLINDVGKTPQFRVPLHAYSDGTVIAEGFEFCIAFDAELIPAAIPLSGNLILDTDYAVLTTDPGSICFKALRHIPIPEDNLLGMLLLNLNQPALNFNTALDINNIYTSFPALESCASCMHSVKFRYLKADLEKTDPDDILNSTNGSIAFSTNITGTEFDFSIEINIQDAYGNWTRYDTTEFTHQFFDPALGVPTNDKYAYNITAETPSRMSFSRNGFIPHNLDGLTMLVPDLDIRIEEEPALACNASATHFICYNDKAENAITFGQASVLGLNTPMTMNGFLPFGDTINGLQKWVQPVTIPINEIGCFSANANVFNNEGDVFSVAFDVIIECAEN